MQTTGDILVVDDESTIVEFMAEVLEDEGYRVRTALTIADAWAATIQRSPDLVLLDFTMPGEAGAMLAHKIKNEGLDIPVILMTADVRVGQEPSIDGIVYCLMKPFDLDDLIDCVATHIRHTRTAA